MDKNGTSMKKKCKSILVYIKIYLFMNEWMNITEVKIISRWNMLFNDIVRQDLKNEKIQNAHVTNWHGVKIVLLCNK